jgi:hypothetical protein
MDQPPPEGPTVDQSDAKPPCTARTKTGGQCRAWALPGKNVCQVHDPSRQAHVQELRARGGKVTALRARRRRLHTINALVRYGGEKLLDVEEGRINLDLGRGLFYALSVQCKLVELAISFDLERRVAAIEAALAEQPRERHQWVA